MHGCMVTDLSTQVVIAGTMADSRHIKADHAIMHAMMLQALTSLFLRYPWIKHGDHSHAAIGNVAHCCVHTSYARGFSFAKMGYFMI